MNALPRRRVDRTAVLLVVTALVVGLSVGGAAYRIKCEEHLDDVLGDAETLLELTNSYVATYAALTADADHGRMAVPASFRAAAGRRFSAGDRRAGRPFAAMIGLAGRAIATPPTDAALAERLARMAADGPVERYSCEFPLGEETVLRTVFPTLASDDSCVDCHNRLQPEGPRWRRGDLMGAYVIEHDIGAARGQTLRHALMLGAFAATATLLGGWLLTYSRRLRAQSVLLRRLADTDVGLRNR